MNIKMLAYIIIKTIYAIININYQKLIPFSFKMSS